MFLPIMPAEGGDIEAETWAALPDRSKEQGGLVLVMTVCTVGAQAALKEVTAFFPARLAQRATVTVRLL